MIGRRRLESVQEQCEVGLRRSGPQPSSRSPVARDVKIMYLYRMSTKLVNVRLDERRLERARRLRAKGITLSSLVRDAIDREYEDLVQSSKRRDVQAIMSRIYSEYPDPAGLPARDYDVYDRREARAAISHKLRRKRR